LSALAKLPAIVLNYDFEFYALSFEFIDLLYLLKKSYARIYLCRTKKTTLFEFQILKRVLPQPNKFVEAN